jgi:hypothetical protein
LYKFANYGILNILGLFGFIAIIGFVDILILDMAAYMEINE